MTDMGTLKRPRTHEESMPELKRKKQHNANAIICKETKVSTSKVQLKTKNTDPDSKPNWKELKKKGKELKVKRKEQRTFNYSTTIKAKQIWEKLRRDDCEPQLRNSLILELHNLLKDNLQKVVFAHDMARVVQWLLKLGMPNIRSSITDELKPVLVSMVQSKYSSFCVKRMLKYGSNESRHLVIQAYFGHVIKLISHSIASPIVEFAYSSWATPTQKSFLKQEFYGDMYKLAKENDVHAISDICSKSPDMISAVLSATKSNLMRVINKGQLSSTLVLSVILDYLSHSSPEDRDEILAQVRPHCLDIIQTREGARVGMMCCWFATNKERKICVKNLKGHVKEIAMSEHGHLFLLALFDSMDDTVLLKKAVISELIPDVAEIAGQDYGRKVMLYLVAHRDPLYFHPTLIDILKVGDSSGTIKKDVEIREAELRQSILTALLESVANETSKWLSSSSIAMVTLAVLKAGEGDQQEQAFKTIAKYICNNNSKIKENDKEYSIVEHSGIHMVLKKLIQHDKEIAKKEHVSFSSVLVQELTESTLLWWITQNRSCFLLIGVIESGIDSADKVLKTKISANVLKHLCKQKSVGAKILLDKVKTE